MKTEIRNIKNTSIDTIADCERVISSVIDLVGLSFNSEAMSGSYVDCHGEPVFSQTEEILIDEQMIRIESFLEDTDEDIFSIGHRLMKEKGIL